MQHPDFTSQLARERQARYRADAGRSRLARPGPDADGRVAPRRPPTATETDGRPALLLGGARRRRSSDRARVRARPRAGTTTPFTTDAEIPAMPSTIKTVAGTTRTSKLNESRARSAQTRLRGRRTADRSRVRRRRARGASCETLHATRDLDRSESDVRVDDDARARRAGRIVDDVDVRVGAAHLGPAEDLDRTDIGAGLHLDAGVAGTKTSMKPMASVSTTRGALPSSAVPFRSSSRCPIASR